MSNYCRKEALISHTLYTGWSEKASTKVLSQLHQIPIDFDTFFTDSGMFMWYFMQLEIT